MLDPFSPWGYERKYATLHGAGRYEDAISTFETMFLKISQSTDPEIRELRRKYVTLEQTRAAIRASIEKAIRDFPLALTPVVSSTSLAKRVHANHSLSLWSRSPPRPHTLIIPALSARLQSTAPPGLGEVYRNWRGAS
ncbi:hypothetical protein OG21DRAFT_1269375 [Imleria badia]|nr:hypothetical protein OG21DRAFT_1269375 [Imleria badia]